MTGASRGVALIAAERQRQIDAEGYTPEHDDAHDGGALAVEAARCAIAHTDAQVVHPEDCYLNEWPYWNHRHRHRGNTMRLLAIAGALIAAEIDRIQRAEESHD